MLNFKTRTGKKDFHFIEQAHGMISQGDIIFKKCCSGWPEIDRGGTKGCIAELFDYLKKSMVLVHKIISLQ